MNRFFDVFLYINFFFAIPVFIIELIRFPVWVEKIDITKNIKGKPIERYLENKYFALEFKVVVTIVLFAAVSIVSILFSSFPREIENPGLLIFIPIMFWIVITGFGGILLGQYFYKTAKKNEIFSKTATIREIHVRHRAQLGIGVFICFYLGCIIAFPIMHMFFLLNLI